MKTVAFHTLGCKVNLYETEAMKTLFQQAGYRIVPQEEGADVFVINTCTVTAVGDKKSRQMIRRAKRRNPNGIVVVAGCYSQVFPQQVRDIPEVDVILGTTGRRDIVQAVEQFQGTRVDRVRDTIPPVYEDMPSAHQDRARATLKIQDGCTNFCSYCIIPYARGPVRSRTVESAVAEVKQLVTDGFTEFVLVGIHLGSYGRDLGLHLMDMVRAVCAVEGVRRVRLGSLEPNLLTQDVVDQLAALPNLCHSFHVSMQSGCTATLKRMNRRYTAEQYLAALGRLRAAMPGCAISTDVIVGFPGETEEEFAQSMETVAAARFSDLHVFPYSKREGTPAARMAGQVDPGVKEERSTRMIALGREMKRQYCESLVGTVQEVLFEQPAGDGLFEGLTKEYVRILAPGQALEGAYCMVQITEVCGDHCKGEIQPCARRT